MTITVCIECNSEIPAACVLCPECGFPAHSSEASCPECLNPVLLSLDACPECGFPLEELRNAHAAEAAAQPPAKDQAVAAQGARAKKLVFVAAADGDPDLATQVLQAQIESLDELTAVIGQMAENSSSAAINELVVSIRKFVNSAENTNNDMLSDLITNIGRFVESSEKIKDDMIDSMKEQSLFTTSAMQEIVTSFSGEVRTAAAGMQEAQKAALAEMNGVAQQVKAAAAQKAQSGGESGASPYVVYVAAILMVFTVLNFFVTAYVFRLVK